MTLKLPLLYFVWKIFHSRNIKMLRILILVFVWSVIASQNIFFCKADQQFDQQSLQTAYVKIWVSKFMDYSIWWMHLVQIIGPFPMSSRAALFWAALISALPKSEKNSFCRVKVERHSFFGWVKSKSALFKENF